MARTLLGILTGLSLAQPLRANLDPKNPNATLYLRVPSVAPQRPLDEPKELTRDATGRWQIGFGQLAMIPYFRPPETLDQPVTGRIHTLRPTAAEPTSFSSNPEDVIPENVRQLDGKKVRLSGFMLPVRMEEGRVKQFLAMRNQMMCCYGTTPGPNEWVVVTMQGKGVEQRMDIPLDFDGTFHVGARFESGVLEGIYRLDCEKVSAHGK